MQFAYIRTFFVDNLCQKIFLSCSIPVNFSFEIKLLQPHPFYTVEPIRGIIPANGNVDIKISFNPLTLGTCILKIQLIIGKLRVQTVPQQYSSYTHRIPQVSQGNCSCDLLYIMTCSTDFIVAS